MNIHIISHTHWDREWYRNFNYFNIKLSYLFESLFEILDTNNEYKHFMLDGQMVMIEDYLLMKPNHRSKLQKYIEDKTIIIGPWYSQPDEFAPDAESLIRNLLIGINQAKELGDYMKIGYLPDSFGHTAQLPQILKGFNIDSACIMRGVPTHKLNQTEFNWKGINDDQVLTVVLPKGYSNGMFLPKDISLADMRVQKTISEMKEYGSTENVLIMEGVDHQLPNSKITDYIKSKESSIDKYLHSTLEDYISDVNTESIKTLNGELISPVTNRVHTSMASTRMTQKQANRNSEKLLENHVEPYLSLSWLHGANYPKELVNNAWKILLKNQTHDSICGCCTDEVHKEIDQRFVDIKSIGETLHKANSRAFSKVMAKGNRTLTVFNDSLVKGKQLVITEVYSDTQYFILKDQNEKEIDYIVESAEKTDVAKLSIWALYMDTPCIVFKTKISFEVDFEFNFGYKIIDIIENKKPKNDLMYKEVESNIIENQYSKVTIKQDGTIDLFDKETNQYFKSINKLEDCGDAGDSYNYSPVDNDNIITNQKDTNCNVKIKRSNLKTKATIEYKLMIPKDLSIDGKSRSKVLIALHVKTELHLFDNSKRIDIKTSVTNNALNHRVRVLFPTNIISTKSIAEIQLGVLERFNTIEESSNWKELGFKEKPLPIYSMQRYVSIKDDECRVSILNKGLTEYEIYNNKTIAITLLRSIGYMGKENLSVRPGRPSGDAQVQGTHSFEYSVLVSDSNITESEITNEAIRYSVGAKAVQNELPLTALKDKLGPTLDLFNIETLQTAIESKLTKTDLPKELISLSSDELVLSTIKKSENEDAMIIRLYNPSYETVKSIAAKLFFNVRKIYECNLLEENQKEIKLSDNSFKIQDVKKFTVKTYKIYFH